jgi:glutathione S-transferase
MALTFYYGSGSPFAWKVWLVLEHKGVPYEFKLLSFDAKDTQKPEFLKVNPRGQVPAIVHDGFALYESGAIGEYLEECFPDKPLLPKDPRERATVRRLALEAAHVSEADTPLFDATLFRGKDEPEDRVAIAAAQETVLKELAVWEARLADGSRGASGGGDWLAGALSLADFTLYPFVRALRRIDLRQPQNGLGDRLPQRLQAWMARIEALPYYAKTIPPHWKT